jgi:hypothetical protein
MVNMAVREGGPARAARRPRLQRTRLACEDTSSDSSYTPGDFRVYTVVRSEGLWLEFL